MFNQLILAIVFSAVIVILAFWRGSLSRSGAAAAFIVGTLTFGLGGWRWGVLLGVFFVSSSLLSHYKEREKLAVSEKFDKGHRRDAWQVLANGGLGALLAVTATVWPGAWWFPLFLGAMATVTADTWATELGTLSKRPPRLITNGRVVEVGTSGGVSALGTAVSFGGGLLIGLVAALITRSPLLPMSLFGALGGLAGSLFDSLLGATVQRLYFCDVRQKVTEKKLNPLGQPNRPVRGWAWMNNDVVNFLASGAGGIVAAALFLLFQAMTR